MQEEEYDAGLEPSSKGKESRSDMAWTSGISIEVRHQGDIGAVSGCERSRAEAPARLLMTSNYSVKDGH